MTKPKNNASPKNSSSTPTPGNGQIIFFEDKKYGGGYSIFDTPVNATSMYYMYYYDGSGAGDNMTQTISSLKVGPNAWLSIFDGENFTGQCLNFYPNANVENLKDYDDPTSHNWGDMLNSFIGYNQIPSSWNLGFDVSSFQNSFPSWKQQSDMDGDYLKYVTQDAGYHVHQLGVTYPGAYTMNISLKICYQITAGTNDKVYLDILVNTDGTLNSITYTYEDGDAVQIPGWVEKAADAAVELAGAVGALETAGLSEVEAQEFVEDFNTLCNVLNKVASAVFKLSQNDDGRFYLVPVVGHVIVRALNAVKVGGSIPTSNNQRINFSSNDFAGHLDQYDGVSIPMENGQYVWDQWSGTSGYLNTVLNYSKNGRSYRTWLHEVDIMRNRGGLIVSCKVDWENGAGDDHLVIMAGFTNAGDSVKMVFAQVSMQFHHDEDQNIISSPYTTNNLDASDTLVYASNLADAIYNDLNAQVQAFNLGSSDTDEGRKALPEIAKANVEAMMQSGIFK